MKTAIIVSKLTCDLSFLNQEKSHYTIACDAGYLNFLNAGLQPDLLIGDFDSLPKEFLNENIPQIKLNPIKDVTDTEYALNYLIDKGFDEIKILGAIGGRLDMTLTTIALLAKACMKNIKISALYKDNIIFPLHDSEVCFKQEASGLISVFSFTDKSVGVDEINLKYPSNNHTLTNLEPLGVSNEFINKKAIIRVKNGILIIITNIKNL